MTLKELRLKAGLTQTGVAKKLDVDQSAISQWENRATSPSRKYHKKIEKLYGCTMDELSEALRASRKDGGGNG